MLLKTFAGLITLITRTISGLTIMLHMLSESVTKSEEITEELFSEIKELVEVRLSLIHI